MAVGEPDEEIAQVGTGFDAARLAGADQTGEARPIPAAFVTTSKERVATVHCRAADGVFVPLPGSRHEVSMRGEVGVDVDAAIIGEQSEALFAAHQVIPTCADQHSWAHLRIPMDLMRAGWSISLFQASQQ